MGRTLKRETLRANNNKKNNKKNSKKNNQKSKRFLKAIRLCGWGKAVSCKRNNIKRVMELP